MAAGKPAVGVSAEVAALTEGVLQAMLISKVKVVGAWSWWRACSPRERDCSPTTSWRETGGHGQAPAVKLPAKADAKPDAAKVGTMWKENYTVEYPGSLPVSVAFSADGKTLLTGDTSGEVMALIFAGDEPRWRWKSKVDGSHAAVAFSADQKKVYATTEHGVRVLDAACGKEEARIETPCGTCPSMRDSASR